MILRVFESSQVASVRPHMIYRLGFFAAGNAAGICRQKLTGVLPPGGQQIERLSLISLQVDFLEAASRLFSGESFDAHFEEYLRLKFFTAV